MKKLLIVGIGLFFLLPFTNNSAQTIAQSTGSYYELAQEYSVQGKEMSKEEEERCLKNISPELKAKLEEVKKLDKVKYYSLLRQAGYLLSYSPPMEFHGTGSRSYTSDPKFYLDQHKKKVELEVNVEYFALKYKNSDIASQQKIKSELQSALNQLFDIREFQKQEEVKQLEKRLQELKESLQARKQNKSEIVQRRIQEMLGDSKYLRWE